MTDAERKDEALRDILDVTTGWSRPLTDAEKLAEIERIASAALRGAS